MANKTTRRALLSSVLALVLCFAMLIGTTFAWFTDSVTSSGNVIESGTLDVQLLMFDGTGYADISGSSDPIFGAGSIAQNNNAETLWEPGKTQVAYLAIKNSGSLALKFTVGLNVTEVVNNLNEVMKYAVVDGAQSGSVTSWTNGETVKKGTSGIYENVSLGVGETHYFALAIHMDESAGNEYQGGSVNFDVTVIATQDTVESDSFGNKYDRDADTTVFVKDIESVREAIAEGGKVALVEDIKVTDEDEPVNAFPGYSQSYPAAVQINKDTDLYLNGNDFAYVGTEEMYYLLHITDGAVVNIYGDSNSILSSTDPAGTNAIAANRNSVVNIYGGTYTSKDISVVDLNTGAVVNIYGGFFYADTYRGDGDQTSMLLNTTNGSTATFHVYGGTYVNFDPRTAQDGNYVDEANYDVVATTQDNGEIWYTVVPKDHTPVFDKTALSEAIESGKKVVIATDLTATEGENFIFEAATSDPVVVDGAGSVITADGVGADGIDYGYVGFVPANGEDATVKNVTVEGSGFVEVGHYGASTGGTYTIDNLTVRNLSATLAVVDGGRNVAAAFSHYGIATITNSTFVGTTTAKEGYTPFDIGCTNKTTTFIYNSTVDSMYIWAQAHVTIGEGTEVERIDSCAITTKNLGMLTIEAGAHVGTLNIIKVGNYTPAITIEDGATVDLITFEGVSYTLDEWLAR